LKKERRVALFSLIPTFSSPDWQPHDGVWTAD
jgi:hypothetical protein